MTFRHKTRTEDTTYTGWVTKAPYETDHGLTIAVNVHGVMFYIAPSQIIFVSDGPARRRS